MKRTVRDDRLGKRGEDLAHTYLRKLGYKILARNYLCPVGELDLIALDGRTLVFAEVKSLQDDRDIHPAESVHSGKQARLRRAARFYISAKRAEEMPARFDVLAVTVPKTGSPKIEHIRDAF